ncbi:MAG: UDP-N-acetylmuramoyl-L-alanyl-D-glutamate--2,6-diaminopimelate ligase [Nitrospirota bacterium]
MKLGTLLTALEMEKNPLSDAYDLEVRDIAYDSRVVQPGSLFVAVRGFQSDGHQFIPDAEQKGAAAIIAERTSAKSGKAPLLVVQDSRRALALLATAFYGQPSQKLKLIGITGTNGKTTTTYLVKSIIETAGRKTGLIGTIDYRIGERVYPAPNTTPESLDLQRLLAEMVDYGAEYCVMEVSSHALELGRIQGCTFAVAGFTNLTQDHLDFHTTMEAYLAAKLKLFTSLSEEVFAVINKDDPNSETLIRLTRAKKFTTGFSDDADIRPAGTINHDLNGLSFPVHIPGGTIILESPLIGKHNVYNILTAIGIAHALGFTSEQICTGIRTMQAVPGRMEKINEGQAYGVLVDYAHTEDALVRLLEAVREITEKRVITVFGCGGDRDRSKRPKMGKAAITGSDVVIVTSDNPRSEDPLAIIREIEQGMAGIGIKTEYKDPVVAISGKKPYYVLPDRQEAIAAAIRMAMPGDIIVLAGKGHETYQIIGSNKMPFDDREAARQEIRKNQRR